MDEVFDSFVFYRSFRESIKDLSDQDQLTTLLAICDYALYGRESDLSGMPLAIFTMARPNIDSNKEKRRNGRKGGRPRKETNGFQGENHRGGPWGNNEDGDENENLSAAAADDGGRAAGGAPIEGGAGL